jgi:hypothetical protein
MPEDAIVNIMKKTLPRGPLKIEDRLINYQIQANRRLEVLKQSVEQDKLKELQAKPKILKKSRVLADIHERKYFSPINVNEPEKKDFKEESPLKPQEKTENHPQITVESVPFANQDQRPVKKRAKSVLGFSVIAKSKEYFNNKEENFEIIVKTTEPQENLKFYEKLKEKNPENLKVSRNLKKNSTNSIQEPENFAEFTFASSPSEKNIKKIDTTAKFMKDEILTPQSVETYADSVDQKPSKLIQKSLAPYQVKVSFDCGIDLEKFMKRAG